MSTEKELNTDNLRDTHWLGEVIDNVDPLKMGRCKVKVLGKYDNLPDDAIPWATPMNRNAVGSHLVPRIGDIVSARFDNGNLYHPEYWFHIDQNLDLKEDILDGAGNAENVISLIYDAERNLRIYHSEEDGLVITRGLGAKERPIIQIDEAGDIKISTGDRIFLDAGNIFLSNTGEPGEDTEQPAVRGLSLEDFLANFIADYKAHIHPTGVGPSGTLQVPFVEGDHKSYQQENK
tara:strand:- start:3133 stop:3834 length:702 start_codon:yes stop_codon:yes gene_type:complete